MNSCTEIAGVPATIYNIENIREAIAFDSKIVLTDSIVLAGTLNAHGVFAVSCNHSSLAIQEILAFCGAEIILLPFDGTQPGLLEDIALLLKPYAFSMTYVSASWSQHFDLKTFFSTREKRLFLEMVTDGARTEYAAWVELEPQAKTGKLSPKIHKGRLVATITKYIPHLVIQNIGDEKNSIYLYVNGKYQWASQFFVKAMIKQFIPTRMMNENLINGVFQLLNMGLERLTPFNELNTNEKYINFQNGLLNLETFELEPHTPELLSTLQLTCNYDPSETNMPNFERYLSDLCTSADGVVDPEKMAVIQEFMGLMLSNIYVYRCKKALLLSSPIGNTGKSVLLNLLGNLMGQSFITNIPLHSMHEGNQFVLGNLPGTRAIIVGDSSANEIKDSALFKQITGGDLLCINQKHRQQFSLKYHGGIILAANNLPTFKDDKGEHMFRRMLIIPCEHALSEAECDGTLETRIYTEKAAIMNWALEGLKRLLNNNLKFTHCSASERVIDEYRMTVDSLYRFIQTNYVITHEKADILSKSEFDAAYSTYCSVNGITALNVTWDDYLIAREESIEERYQEYLKTVTGSSSDESRKHYKLSKAEMSIARTVDLGKFVMTVFADENRFYKDDYGYVREKGSNMKIDTKRNKFFLNDDNKNNKISAGNPIEYLQMLGFDFVTSVTILMQFNQGQDVKAYFKRENDANVLSDDNAFRFYMQWQTT